jgi:hypothetical protein
MPLTSLIITLIVVGVLLWLVNTYIPMDGKIKKNSQHRRGDLRRLVAVVSLWRARSFRRHPRAASPVTILKQPKI